MAFTFKPQMSNQVNTSKPGNPPSMMITSAIFIEKGRPEITLKVNFALKKYDFQITFGCNGPQRTIQPKSYGVDDSQGANGIYKLLPDISSSDLLGFYEGRKRIFVSVYSPSFNNTVFEILKYAAGSVADSIDISKCSCGGCEDKKKGCTDERTQCEQQYIEVSTELNVIAKDKRYLSLFNGSMLQIQRFMGYLHYLTEQEVDKAAYKINHYLGDNLNNHIYYNSFELQGDMLVSTAKDDDKSSILDCKTLTCRALKELTSGLKSQINFAKIYANCRRACERLMCENMKLINNAGNQTESTLKEHLKTYEKILRDNGFEAVYWENLHDADSDIRYKDETYSFPAICFEGRLHNYLVGGKEGGVLKYFD